MKLNKTIYAVMIILLLCSPQRLVAQQPEYFPLAEGTTWIYNGTVKWTEAEDKIKERKITWKMEVERRLRNGPFEIAVMKGHPGDLCWYEPGKGPSSYLIVWRDNKYYEIRIYNDFDKLTCDETYLSTKTNFNTLFLVVPLKKDMEFGNDSQREDLMYEWVVDDEQRGNLSHVAGVLKTRFKKFTLMYRTNPDHQIVEFVPQIGITHYIYQHHGTVSEVDVRLTAFRKK